MVTKNSTINVTYMEQFAVWASSSAGGNVSRAARDLNLSRATLHRKIRAFGLDH